MKKEIPADKFFAMCDRFDAASFKCGNFWPSIHDIQEYIEPNIEQNLDFLIWISETAGEPSNPDEVDSRTYINELIQKHLVLTD